MIGALLNGACIVAGGIAGGTAAWEISARNQQRLRILLGAFTVYGGWSVTWAGLHGSFWQVAKQFGIVVLALMLGRFTGHLLRIQQAINGLGRYAKERLAAAETTPRPNFTEGFETCTVLFCTAPLALLGALHEGLKGDFRALLIKSIMDGLATVAFRRVFGGGVLLAALPVVVYQGTLTLGVRALAPWLERQALVDVIYATSGMMVFTVALVILELKKVPLADYLPSLLFAPLLSWWLR